MNRYAFLFVGVVLLFPASTFASTFTMPRDIAVSAVNQTFTLPITITPSDGSQYTVRFAMTFPEALEVISFAYAPGWLVVEQPGYHGIDNAGGTFVRTAGFPGGLTSPKPFGVVTLRAKKAGEAVVTVAPQSFILNADSNSTLESRPQIRVTVATPLPPVTSRAPTSSTTPSSSTAQTAPPLADLPVEEQNLFDITATPQQPAQVRTAGEGLVSRVAPGEFLPISTTLSNFGSPKRVDVRVSYEISNTHGRVIYASDETVAVETTASFVKTIQIPFDTAPGRYVARSAIIYQDQLVPATTEFPFIVERKIFGLFQSTFYLYGGIVLVASLLAGVLGHQWVRRRRRTRGEPIDYSHVPKAQRVFYELISDTILQMRQHVGDKAIRIAMGIDGLTINNENGKVLNIKERPANVMSTLVQRYEKALGQKINLAFARTGGRPSPRGKNIITIKSS